MFPVPALPTANATILPSTSTTHPLPVRSIASTTSSSVMTVDVRRFSRTEFRTRWISWTSARTACRSLAVNVAPFQRERSGEAQALQRSDRVSAADIGNDFQLEDGDRGELDVMDLRLR